MFFKSNLLPVRRKQFGGLLLLLLLSIIGVAFGMAGNNDFHVARREILLRRIGHQVLLQAGDSISRMLPVEKLAGNEYRLRFERPFTFRPDSLVHTTQHWLAKDPLGTDYVVTVLACADSSVAYGYAISGNNKEDIIACLGRVQPKACYVISIKFGPAEGGATKRGYLLGGLALLAMAAYAFWSRATPQSELPEKQAPMPEDHPSAHIFTLGAMLFDAEGRKLVMAGKTIDLTKTETRVLRIFAAAPNEAIERSRLQKEIWEDEGVIVGRSLDMFISKLRKKLEGDPGIRIVVIRGKGYKLQISASENLSAPN